MFLNCSNYIYFFGDTFKEISSSNSIELSDPKKSETFVYYKILLWALTVFAPVSSITPDSMI